MSVGIPIRPTARLIAATPSLSERPGAKLKEMVFAGKRPWWLTASDVRPGSKRARAASGTIVSTRVEIAEPVEIDPRPLEAIALVARFRAESPATIAAFKLLVLAALSVVPATAFVAWTP